MYENYLTNYRIYSTRLFEGFPQAASKNLITTKTFPIYSPIFDISCVTFKTLHVSDYLNFISTLSFFVYKNPVNLFLFASS